MLGTNSLKRLLVFCPYGSCVSIFNVLRAYVCVAILIGAGLAIVMDFNVCACWAALPTGERYRLPAGCNCKMGRPGMANSATQACSHDEGKSERSITGVHRSVMGGTEQSVTGGVGLQQVGM